MEKKHNCPVSAAFTWTKMRWETGERAVRVPHARPRNGEQQGLAGRPTGGRLRALLSHTPVSTLRHTLNISIRKQRNARVGEKVMLKKHEVQLP